MVRRSFSSSRVAVLGASFEEADLLADFTKVASSVELDAPVVGGDGYWQRIERQPNIDPDIKKRLKDGYPE